MISDSNKEMVKRLDAIVALLLEIKDKDGKMQIKEKVRILNDAGLDYNQIAKILNKSPGNIAVQLTFLKKEEADKVKPQKLAEALVEAQTETEVKRDEVQNGKQQ